MYCPNCVSPVKNRDEMCSSCGAKIDRKKLSQLRKFAAAAMRYGYEYRISDEAQIKRYGRITSQYCLAELSPIFEFIGLAVLSGIIGNTAYAVVKAAVLRLAASQPKLAGNEKKLLERLVGNEEALHELDKYLREYLINPKGFITKESDGFRLQRTPEFIKEASAQLMKEDASDRRSKGEIRKLFDEAIAAQAVTVSSKDFQGLFCDVPIEKRHTTNDGHK